VVTTRSSRFFAAFPLALVAVAVTASAPNAIARDHDVEPLWHVFTSADAAYVDADQHGSVVTGLRGEILSTDQIGARLWEVAVTDGDERVLSPPAMSESRVFVPVERRRVVAIDRASGAERWNEPVAGIVDVAGSAAGDALAVLTRTRVELRDGAAGSLVWGVDVSIPEVLAAPPRVFVRTSVVLVAWTDAVSHLRAFDRTSGRLLWQRDQEQWQSTPAVDERAVYVAENQRRSADGTDTISVVLRLHLATGVVEWERRVRGLFFPTFVGDVERSTVAIVDVRGRVFALDARTGRIRWRRVTGARQFENRVHVGGDVVAFTTLGTGIVVLDRRDGSPVANESPGRAQPWSIIRASVSTGDQLYLLTHPNGPATADGVLLMLPTGPDGYAPGYDIDVRRG
jgi:outer membrane protein assembly factor BamB